MTKSEIIEEIANQQMVEHFVENVAKRPLDTELRDLCQVVYLILCEYEEAKLQDLWANHQITFFIARIITNQYLSKTSQFYYTYKIYQKKAVSLGAGADITDYQIEQARIKKHEDG